MSLTLYIDNKAGKNKIITHNGSSVTVYLNPNIQLNKDKNYTLRLLQASIVFCEPNITSQNSVFMYWTNTNDVNTTTQYTYNIETGIYSLDDLNEKIGLITNSQCGKKLFYFLANESTGKIYVFFSEPNCSIVCDINNCVMPILGFSAVPREIGNFSTIDNNSYVESIYKSKLTPIHNILIKTDLVENCAYLDARTEPIIGSVQPNVSSYNTIIYMNKYPQRCNLLKYNIDRFNIQLTNEDNEPLNMTGSNINDQNEVFTLQLEIEEV